MEQYLKLCQHILDHGALKNDRTNTGTRSVFGYQMRFDLSAGFPLMTTKKIYTRAVFHELLWFISGNTNIEYLVKNKVNIWNEWAYEKFKVTQEFKHETLEEFVLKIANDHEFALKHGNLGPVYGKQWRNFNGVDQLAYVINEIKTNPDSRRIVLSAWNPSEINDMALPPCHVLMQFNVTNHKLNCQLYQRSADVFLGVPFNIASYALLTHVIADVCGLQVGEFVHTLGDAHIYSNHIDQIKLQLSRDVYPLCTLNLKNHYDKIEDYRYEDIEIHNYQCHPTIKGEIAV